MESRSVLLYLHGFNSSPNSAKAQAMADYLQAFEPKIQFVCPQLACHPLAAWQQIEKLLQQHQQQKLAVVGSSLGGFLATRVAQLTGARAVLVNPAVKPYRLLKDFLGEQVNPYTQQRYFLEEQHIQQLKDLEVTELSCQQQLWVMLQTADEVLDFSLAVAEYKGANFTIEEGGDHSFQGFERHCAAILDFLALR
ncbi:YqiA/YcfP family alpha/beta fold hydrolase [Agarivorans gilvus]|uniref:Esterase YqiA n=1 Tax=Agarivorans gilvus TaxID=680279 RepID=A0ABQ1I2M9_9ALTE|nr:YqiA/YcfP family alpha/beta fold hydrolase [Agarivorans gilvus]GGB05548.1 esterase YqiA [Agarivorans gilvus]